MCRTKSIFFNLLCILFITAVSAIPLEAATGITPPLGDRWFGVFLGNDRTGFVHQRITEKDGGFEISVEGSVKMVVMGFSRDASSRERYLVGRDLALKSFETEQILDGTPMKLSGTMVPRGIRVIVESGGERREKLLTAKGPVYPPPALNILPLMKGVSPGRRLRVPMLDVESIKVKHVTITVVGLETLPSGNRTIHLRNDLFPLVDNDIWVDMEGNTLRESVRGGLVETFAEDEGRARLSIADAAISRRDMILDFSMVRIAPPLANPAGLTRLVLAVDGIPAAMMLPEGGGQKVSRNADGTVLFTVEPSKSEAVPLEEGERKRLTGTTDRIPADHPRITTLSREIIGEEPVTMKRVERLVHWVSDTVEDAVIDAPSPLDTLRLGKGNCQSHTRLYASLARAAGIPTRFVSGLAYLQGKGFLYHSWAESFVDGKWLQVDPTFGQVPVDATHVKLVEGENPDDLATMAGIIGRIGARVLEAR